MIAVTEADAQAMRPLTATPVSVVVNGVDSRAFAQVSADAQSQRLLFVGNYEYAPNLDAVQWLLEEIFPGSGCSVRTRAWRWPVTACPNTGATVGRMNVSSGWGLFLICALCNGAAPVLSPRCAMAAAPSSRC